MEYEETHGHTTRRPFGRGFYNRSEYPHYPVVFPHGPEPSPAWTQYDTAPRTHYSGHRGTESRYVEEPGRPNMKITNHYGSDFQQQSAYDKELSRRSHQQIYKVSKTLRYTCLTVVIEYGY